MSNKRSSEHSTPDIYYAAFLMTAGEKMLRTDREGNRVYFVFENSPHLQDLKMAFFNRSEHSKVPALDYADNVKSVKTLTHLDNK